MMNVTTVEVRVGSSDSRGNNADLGPLDVPILAQRTTREKYVSQIPPINPALMIGGTPNAANRVPFTPVGPSSRFEKKHRKK